MKEYKNFANIEVMITESLTETFIGARDMGVTFVGEEEFLDGVEADMEMTFQEWLATGRDLFGHFDKSNCEAIIDQNAVTLMKLKATVEKLGLPYRFNVLDPVSFVEDFFCVVAREYTKDFIRYSNFANMIFNVKFKFTWKDEYILSKELFDYASESDDRRVYRLVMGIIEKAKATEG